MPRLSPFTITLTAREETALESIARRYTSPYYQVVRAKAILMAAQGLRNDEIATRVSLPRQIVSKWRKRFFEERLEGLENLPRSGRFGRRKDQHPSPPPFTSHPTARYRAARML